MPGTTMAMLPEYGYGARGDWMNCHLQLLNDSKEEFGQQTLQCSTTPPYNWDLTRASFTNFVSCGTLEDKKLRIIWEGVLPTISHISKAALC